MAVFKSAVSTANKIRKTVTKPNYLKNAIKSITFVAADIAKEAMPDVASFYETNKDFVKQTYSSVKNPSAAVRKLSSAFQVRKIYQSVDYGFKNLKDDLMSGDFYNKEREERDTAKMLGFDFNLDDLSEFGISDDWEKELEEGSGDNTVTQGDLRIVNSIESSNAAMTQSVVRSVIMSAENSTKNARLNTGALFEQNERLFSGLHTDLVSIGALVDSIHAVTTKVLPNMDENLAKFQTELIALNTERNDTLKKILDKVSEKPKLAQDIMNDKNNGNSKAVTYSDLVNFNGIPDLQKYFDIVKNKASNELSMMTMGFSPADLINMFAVNPTREVLKTVLTKYIIPKNLKNPLSDMSNMLGGLFANAMAKFHNKRNDFGLMGTISSILGMNPSVNRNLSTSGYAKGEVAWDGISRKALTGVIPGYLRRIESALTGRAEIDYNYDTGKWTTLTSTSVSYGNIKKDYANRATFDLIYEMNPTLNKLAPADDRKRAEYNTAIDQFRQYLYDNNGQFYPYESAEYNGIKQTDYPLFYKYYTTICKAYNEFDIVDKLDAYGNAVGKKHIKNAVRFRVAHEVMSNKVDEERIYRSMESKGDSSNIKLKEYGSGYNTKEYNDLLATLPQIIQDSVKRGNIDSAKNSARLSSDSDKYIDTINRLASMRDNTSSVAVNASMGNGLLGGKSLLTTQDSFGQTIYSYLHNINKELMWQRMNGGTSIGTTVRRMPARNRGGINFDTLSESLYTDTRRNEIEALKNASTTTDTTTIDRFTLNANENKKEALQKVASGTVEDLRNFSRDQQTYLLELYKSSPDKVSSEYQKYVGYGYNDKAFKAFFKKQFRDANITNKELLEKAIEKANTENKNTYEVITPDDLAGINKLMSRLRVSGNDSPIQAILNAPAEVFSNILYAADRSIYEMFFKHNTEDEDHNYYSGFMEFMVGKTKRTFDKLTKAISEKIIDPLKKKLGISDEFKGRFFDQLKETGGIIGRSFINANRDVWMDPLARQFLKNDKTRGILQEVAPKEYDRLISQSSADTFATLSQRRYRDRNGNIVERENYITDEYKKRYRDVMLGAYASGDTAIRDRLRTVGFEGSIGYKWNKLKELGIPNERIEEALSHATTDEEKDAILNKIYMRRDIKNHAAGTPDGKPYMGNTMLSEGELLFNNSGVSLVNKTGAYAITEPTQIMSSQDAYDTLSALGLPTPKTKKTRARDEALENIEKKKLLDKHAGGTFRTKKWTNRGVTEQDVQTAIQEAKNFAPELTAGAAVGGGASLLLGLVGGPLLGAAIGAATMLTTKSTKMQEILFGKMGSNGERSDSGIISKSIQDTVKKYAPNMGKFGAVGAAASLITPFGILGGLAVGAGIGYLKTNDEVREKLFGKLKVRDAEKAVLKKLAPNTIKGAAIGAAATFIGGPFGLLGNAAVGAAVGMMTSTDEFKNGLLGDIVNGVRHGGVLGTVRDAFRPLTSAAEEFKDRIFNAVDKNLVQPLADFVQPAIHALPQLASIIPRAINHYFLDKFSVGIDAIVKKVVAKPLEAMLKPVAKIGSGVFNAVTYPARLLGKVGNKIRTKQMDTLNADYMTADERMEWDIAHGRNVKDYDKFFASIGSENFTVDQAKEMRDNLSTMIDTQDDLQRAKEEKNKEINKVLRRYKTADGYTISGKARSEIAKALDRKDMDAIPRILMKYKLDGTDVGMTDKQVMSIMHDDGLQKLIGQYTDLNTRAVKARNMTEEDREAARQRSDEILEQAGLKGVLDLSNRNDIEKFIKYFDTEIQNKSGLDLDDKPFLMDNYKNIKTITELLQKWDERLNALKDVGDAQTIAMRKAGNGSFDESIKEAAQLGDWYQSGMMQNPIYRMMLGGVDYLSDDMWKYVQDHPEAAVGAFRIQNEVFNPAAGALNFGLDKDATAFAEMTPEQQERYRGGRNIDLPIIGETGIAHNFAPRSALKLRRVYNLKSSSGKPIKFNDDAKTYLDSLTDIKYKRLIAVLKDKYIGEFMAMNPITVEDMKILWDINAIQKQVSNKCKLVLAANAIDKYPTIKSVLSMSGTELAQLESQIAPDNHFLGTLIGGALNIGKSIVSGISNIFNKDNEDPSKKENTIRSKLSNITSLFSSATSAVSTPSVSDTNETDKEGDGRDVAAIGSGFGYIKRNADGSVEPDASDNNTKKLLNEQEQEKSAIQKLREAQLKASESIKYAFGEGKEKAKKGLGWLGALLLGGALWKSGVLQRLFNGVVKPIWTDHLKPWITDTAWPGIKSFVSDTVIPGVGSMLGSALYAFGTSLPGFLKGIVGGLNGFLDAIVGNKNNAGSTTIVDSNDKSGESGITDSKGKKLTWEEIKSGNNTTVYNAEGEAGTVNANGTVTFKDRSLVGSSYASTVANAAVHAFANPKVGTAVGKTITKGGSAIGNLLGHLGLLGKAAGVAVKGGTTAVGAPIAGAAKGQALIYKAVGDSLVRNGLKEAAEATVEAAAKTAVEATTKKQGLAARILAKSKEMIGKFFANPTVADKLTKAAKFLKVDKVTQWVTGICSKIQNYFDDIIMKACERLGVEVVEGVAEKVTVVIAIVMLIKDFLWGCDQAESILGVTSTNIIDELVCGIVNALGNFLILPAIWPGIPKLTQAIYGFFSKNLKNRQKEADDEYQQYVDDTGSTLTKEEYLKKQYSYIGKIGAFFVEGWRKTKRTVKGWLSKPTTVIPKPTGGSLSSGGAFGKDFNEDIYKSPTDWKKTGAEIRREIESRKKTAAFGKGYSKQNDPSIANIRYNTGNDSLYQTIGDSGCGPAAAVNAIESIFGNGNGVYDAAEYALSNGYKETDGGTKPGFFGDYLSNYGIDSSTYNSKNTMEKSIRAGVPTILMGKDSNGTSNKTPFGKSPHYVTVTGMSDGKAVVQDPESRYDNQLYDINDIVSKSSIGVSAYGRGDSIGQVLTDTVMNSPAGKVLASFLNTGANTTTTDNSQGSYDSTSIGDSTSYTGGSTTANNQGKFPTYNLNDRQIKGIANILQNEQMDKPGWLAEASLMANLTDISGDDKATTANLIKSATGGWFADGQARYNNPGAARQGPIDAARKVLIEGYRTMPRYINEHDCFSDLKSVTNDGKAITPKSNRNAYIANKTKIKNVYGSDWTFFAFPSNLDDPFGYTSESMRAKWGEDHYSSTGMGLGTAVKPLSKYGRATEVPAIGQVLSDTIMNSPAGKIFASLTDLGNNATDNTGTMSGNSYGDTLSSGAITASGDPAKVVQAAQNEVGTTENPKGSNSIKYNKWYWGYDARGQKYPWCAAFVSWAGNAANIPVSIIPKNASSGGTYDFIGSHGGSYPKTADGRPGDIAYFTKNGARSGIYHTGIVENVSDGKINTIEGNTSDMVARRTYDVNNRNVMLARPNYANTSGDTIDFSNIDSNATTMSNASTDSTEGPKTGYGTNTNKPMGRFGQFRKTLSGFGKKFALKDENGFHEVEQTPEDASINKALQKPQIIKPQKKVKFGRGDAQLPINYSGFFQEIVKLLIKIAQNSDKLNNIIKILDEKYDIKVSSTDIANVQNGSSSAEKLAAIISNSNQAALSKLNTYADTVGDTSIITIMSAMNAIAME